MLTQPAVRSLDTAVTAVTTMARLQRAGWTRSAVRAQLAAHRWQRQGRAIISHNGPLSLDQTLDVALINCGPRSVLTSFTAITLLGMQGWQRPGIHVLVPGGARLSSALAGDVHVHYARSWSAVQVRNHRRVHSLPQALLVAADSLTRPRAAVGLLAAAVQQRRIRPPDLQAELARSDHVRHRGLLISCMHDIAQGSEALSEIDFIQLCRAARLPLPHRQAIRLLGGRRRYLDAEWVRRDGRTVVAEVDGALHLAAPRWYADQLRQNEVTLSGSLVLRFPSVVLRTEPQAVIEQLRRALR